MAYTLSLVAGTTTLNLIDGSNYALAEGGLSLPTPPQKQVWGGDNPYRSGSALIESAYHNRTVSLRLSILGSSDDVLATNKRALDNALRAARVFSTYGIGSQVELRLKLTDGSVTLAFDVIDGVMEFPDDWFSVILDKYSRIGTRGNPCRLTLVCKPFARGTEVTLENAVRNPGFELGDAGSLLHDWAATNVTASRDTTATVPEGTYWGKALSNCIAGQQGYLQQSITWSNDYRNATWYLRIEYRCPVANDREQRIEIYDGVDTTVSAILTKSGATVTLNMSHTFNAAATQGRIRIYANYVAGADVDDYLLVDQCYFGPNDPSGHSMWISGRHLSNRNDPDNLNSADDINYVDIMGVGGDVPGRLKLYCIEGQAENRMVFGARHGAEARDLLWREQGGAADAALSNADYQEMTVAAGVGYKTGGVGSSITLATPPTGLFRCFIRIDRINADITKFGLGWTYGSLSLTPSSVDYLATVPNYNWYDLGALQLPPIDLPSGETEPSFVINLWAYNAMAGLSYAPRIDALMLFPLRPSEGYIVAEHGGTTRQLLLDSERGVFVMTTASVLDSVPTALVGRPTAVDPVATRLHLLAPGTAALTNTYTLRAKITPRYLHI